MSKEKRNFHLQIQNACDKDDFRPAMQHVYFDNGFMVATDSYILIKAPVLAFSDFDHSEVELLNGKFIHRQTFAKILKCQMVEVKENGIVDMATGDTYQFTNFEGNFPDYNKVISDVVGQIDTIRVNPSILQKLSKILSNDSVGNIKMVFEASNRAIKIFSTHNESFLAILMPVA